MPNSRTPHAIAQGEARKHLVNKYRTEYDAIYRAHVLALGGKVHPSKEQRIANLKALIAELEAGK
jgi:hypothetical protein